MEGNAPLINQRGFSNPGSTFWVTLWIFLHNPPTSGTTTKRHSHLGKNKLLHANSGYSETCFFQPQSGFNGLCEMGSGCLRQWQSCVSISQKHFDNLSLFLIGNPVVLAFVWGSPFTNQQNPAIPLFVDRVRSLNFHQQDGHNYSSPTAYFPRSY